MLDSSTAVITIQFMLTNARIWSLNDESALYGGRWLNQTLTALEPGRLFRLSFSGAVFGLVELNGVTCNVRVVTDGVVRETIPIDASVDGSYRSYSRELTIDEDAVLGFDFTCGSSGTDRVTINFAIDDITLNDIGPAPAEEPVTSP
jgi:hypothetical protein